MVGSMGSTTAGDLVLRFACACPRLVPEGVLLWPRLRAGREGGDAPRPRDREHAKCAGASVSIGGNAGDDQTRKRRRAGRLPPSRVKRQPHACLHEDGRDGRPATLPIPAAAVVGPVR